MAAQRDPAGPESASQNNGARVSDRQVWPPTTEAMVDLLLNVLEQACIPFAIINSNAEVLTANTLFNTWSLARPRNLRTNLKGNEQRALIQALAEARAEKASRFLALGGAEDQIILQVFALRELQSNGYRSDLGGVVVRGRGQRLTLDAASLMAMFGLTQREAGIAVAIGHGISVAEIARQNQVIPGTIRVQLKAIFRKMEVRSQLELAAKLHF